MEKHLFRTALTTVLLLAMLAPCAWAASCVSCGSDLESRDNYCWFCGAKVEHPSPTPRLTPTLTAVPVLKDTPASADAHPAAASPMSSPSPTASPTPTAAPMPSVMPGEAAVITDCRLNEDSTLRIVWEGGTGPWVLQYRYAQDAPIPFCWVAADGLTQPDGVISHIIPSMGYKIRVVDSLGAASAWYDYTAPAADTLNLLGTRMDVSVFIDSVLIYNLRKLPIAEVMKHLDDRSLGVKANITYDQLVRARTYHFQFVLTAPSGVKLNIESGEKTLERGRSSWTGHFIPLNTELHTLLDRYGGIPLGEYTLQLLYNGNIVAANTFFIE